MVRYHDDVDFEAELRAYLEQIAAGSRSGTAAAGRDIDEHAVRAYFLRRLGEFEAGGGGRVAEKMFHVWSGRVAVFARYIASLPGATAPTDAAGAQAFAERALEVAVGLPSATPRERSSSSSSSASPRSSREMAERSSATRWRPAWCATSLAWSVT
jgi:hypothetical protein